MNIKQFKKYLCDKLNSYPKVWNKEERMIHLVEEVGELAEIILQYNGSKKPKKNIIDIKNALVDVLDDIFALSLLYGIDINDLLEELTNEKNK